MRPDGSISMHFASTSSPSLTTSVTFSTRPSARWLMWISPSVPGKISERTEVGDPLHLAEIDAVELGLLRALVDHPLCELERSRVGREDRDDPRIVDVDLGARGVLDAADHLAAGPDHVADPIGLDRDHLHARRIARQLRARPEIDELARGLLLHAVEDVEPAHARLLQCSLEHAPVDAADLDVHLQRRDPRAGTRDLEVHVAEMVLVAEDVGEDRHAAALFDQAHRDPRDR